MSLSKRMLIVCAFVLGPAQAQAQKPTTATSATAPTYETLRNELQKVYADWSKHRRQEIAVLDIKGINQVGGKKDEEKQLMLRLETLQNKGISNREWATYWQTEADLALRMASLYAKLAPEEGLSPLLAEQKAKQRLADAAGIKERSKQDAFVKAETERIAAEKAVRSIINGLADNIREGQAAVAKLKVLRDEQTQAVAKLNSQLAAITDAEQKPPVEEALKGAQAGLTDITTRYEDALQKTKALELQQQTVSELLSGTPVDMAGLEDANKVILNRYTTASRQYDAAKKEKDDAKKVAGKLTAESNQAKIDIKRFRERRPALIEWSELAKKKVKNQGIYYNAIQADINAVNKRLRGLEKVTKEVETTNIRQACQPSLTAKETPFTRHRTCIQAMQRDIEELSVEQEQVRQKEKLTGQLGESVARLISAQITDEELVNQEVTIGQKEWERSKSSIAELGEWRTIWALSYERAVLKSKQLSAAVITSKQSERTLKAKLGVYRDTLKRISETLAASKVELNEKASFSNTIVSVVQTAWQIIRVGWPALIYLFIAFLILRFIGRYRDRSEQKAIEAQEGEGNEELDELERLLAKAEAEDDEERELELHEEIGKLENRIKDEGQRIATIARVASQALSLIVYVATFLLVLDALTVDIKPILGGAAIFGLAISFGSQSLVKDVVSGFFILLENQYAVGDVVSINGNSGTVEKVTLRRTVLRDGKGAVHNITNGSVSSVTNSTQGWARVIVHVGVAYGTDLSQVEDVINQVGEDMYDDPKWSGKLTEKPSYVGVTALGASDVQVRAMFKTKTFQNWGAEREFNRRILAAFEAAGIDIPFPTQTLLVTNDKKTNS